MWHRVGAFAAVLCACILLSPTPAESGQSIDASLRAEIEKLLEITGSAQMGAQGASLMSGQFLEILRKSDPSIPERALALVKQVLDAEFAMAFSEPGGLTEQLVVIYARHFSREEVRALLSFYSSDLGRKVIASMPVVFQESAAAGQQWAQKHMPRIRKTIETRLRDEGLIK